MPWRSIFRGDTSEDEPPSEGTYRLFHDIRFIHEITVGEHHVDPQFGRVGAQHLQMTLG